MSKKLIVFIGIIYIIFSTTTTYAEAPTRGIDQYTPQELVSHFAQAYKVSEIQMSETIKCESSFNPSAVGDHGKSLGLVQIFLPAHKNITKKQALDPVFATEYMAKSFQDGKQSMWSCYRMMYKKHL